MKAIQGGKRPSSVFQIAMAELDSLCKVIHPPPARTATKLLSPNLLSLNASFLVLTD